MTRGIDMATSNESQDLELVVQGIINRGESATTIATATAP